MSENRDMCFVISAVGGSVVRLEPLTAARPKCFSWATDGNLTADFSSALLSSTWPESSSSALTSSSSLLSRFGGFVLTDAHNYVIYYNRAGVNSVPVFLNMMHQALLRYLTGKPILDIKLQYSGLKCLKCVFS